MLIITLPLPHADLSPNARVHRMQLARRKKKARLDGGLAAKVAINASNLPTAPRWAAVTVECHWFFRERRRRDSDNLTASLKAAMDGLTDAGVWLDDSGVKPLPPVIAYDAADPRVEIVVRPVQPGNKE